MKTAIAIPVLTFLTLAVPGEAGDWSSLGRVPKDRTVKVYLANGKRLNGTILQVGDQGLQLVPEDRRIQPAETGAVQICRTEIRRVTWRSHGIGALIGLAMGAAGGSAYGAATAGSDKHDGHKMPGTGASAVEGAGIIGVMGAAAGAIVGKERTIYDSESAKRIAPASENAAR